MSATDDTSVGSTTDLGGGGDISVKETEVKEKAPCDAAAVNEMGVDSASVSNKQTKKPVAGVSSRVISAVLNEYGSYRPTSGAITEIERVEPTIEPSQLFERFISQRRPVVITGLLTDENWRGHLWTNEYLMKTCGNVRVSLEDLKSSDRTRSEMIEARYRDFLGPMMGGETRFQLVTSDEQSSAFDLEHSDLVRSTIVEPLLSIIGDLPLRPSILGNLVIHKVALDQGTAGPPNGVSTGLRHEFHDRLCLVLRGQKRVRLFPPDAAVTVNSRQACKPSKIYSNGLIVYSISDKRRTDVPVRPDGAPFEAVARRNRDDAEYDLTEAENRLFRLQDMGAENQPELRAQLDRARQSVQEREQLLDSAETELRRFDGELDGDRSDDVISIHDDDSEPDDDGPAAKKPRTDEVVESEVSGNQPQQLQPGLFTDVELAVGDTTEPGELFAQCAELASVGCLTADLQAGHMLYIPASWLYEITSYNSGGDICEDSSAGGAVGTAGTSSADSASGAVGAASTSNVDSAASVADSAHSTSGVVSVEQRAGHLSLCYWSHPPDSASFERPYSHNFWPRRFVELESKVERMAKKARNLTAEVICVESGSSSGGSDSSESESESYEGNSEENDDDNYDTDGNSCAIFERAVSQEVDLQGHGKKANAEILLDDDSSASDDCALDESMETDADVVTLSGKSRADSSVLLCEESSEACPAQTSNGDLELEDEIVVVGEKPVADANTSVAHVNGAVADSDIAVVDGENKTPVNGKQNSEAAADLLTELNAVAKNIDAGEVTESGVENQ